MFEKGFCYEKPQVTIKPFMSIIQYIQLYKIILRMWDCSFEDIQCAVTSFIPDFQGKFFPIQDNNIL